MIMSDNNRTVRIAKNNLCAHVDQFIDKEKTALEHLLMNQYTTFCLGSHYQHDAQQVGVSPGQEHRQWS